MIEAVFEQNLQHTGTCNTQGYKGESAKPLQCSSVYASRVFQQW